MYAFVGRHVVFGVETQFSRTHKGGQEPDAQAHEFCSAVIIMCRGRVRQFRMLSQLMFSICIYILWRHYQRGKRPFELRGLLESPRMTHQHQNLTFCVSKRKSTPVTHTVQASRSKMATASLSKQLIASNGCLAPSGQGSIISRKAFCGKALARQGQVCFNDIMSDGIFLFLHRCDQADSNSFDLKVKTACGRIPN